MKLATIAILFPAGQVWASFDKWSPPGPYDVRGPCPMLNTLANHGFLPHDGKDITREIAASALFDGLHINKTLGGFLFDFGVTTNPKPNATSFSLNDLGNHNILEHDASLSRTDAYFGSTIAFNQSIFDETKAHWTADTVTLQMSANARTARIKASKATNPEYSMSNLGDGFSLGESVAYVIVIGDKKTATVKRSWLEWFFQHEQLPQHLGWKRAETPFEREDLDVHLQTMRNLTADMPAAKRKRAMHFGW
ncbi:Chloroperoxidase [Podospora aff. communis PSN243]|uniref:Chloroperoxidase n=1 Tax=Podospora aff. communis PSN243 TaxID=3040156 RepID=A0AAV9GWA6_9PEZI|nr:Chloroperoxidase [Podospora aff. communis PSN243]